MRKLERHTFMYTVPTVREIEALPNFDRLVTIVKGNDGLTYYVYYEKSIYKSPLKNQ